MAVRARAKFSDTEKSRTASYRGVVYLLVIANLQSSVALLRRVSSAGLLSQLLLCNETEYTARHG